MVLKSFIQNKCYSDSNVSKNNPKPCTSNFSECRVQKLIQKYEDLTLKSAENNISQWIRHSTSEQNISQRHSVMLSDFQLNLNRQNVYRFLSLDNHDNEKKCKGKNEKNSQVKMSKIKGSCDEEQREKEKERTYNQPRVKKRDDMFKFLAYFSDSDKDKKCEEILNKTKKDNTYRKYDFDKYDKNKRQEYYCNSLPHVKNKDEKLNAKCSRSFSTNTSRNKFKYVSNNSNNKDKVQTMLKDESSIVQSQIHPLTSLKTPNTGAIKKQINLDDSAYRKRRNSYLMATQHDDSNNRKFKTYSENPESNKSYVSKTIAQYEEHDNRETKPLKKKVEEEIRQLFQQYHDNKKFGKSNKMTREELNLEIDNVLLNKFKQISSDNVPEVSTRFPVAGNHSNLHQNITDSSSQNSQTEDNITLTENSQEISEQFISEDSHLLTDYIIVVQDSEMSTNVDSVSQGPNLSTTTSNVDTQNNLNVRDKLNEQLTKVLSKDNLQNSVESLCDDIERDLHVLNKSLSEIGEQIKDVLVIQSDEEGMYENNSILSCRNGMSCENMQYIIMNQNNSEENEIKNCEPKRKVSNLINFFTDKIAEVQDKNKQSVSSNHVFICDIQLTDNVFEESKNSELINCLEKKLKDSLSDKSRNSLLSTNSLEQTNQNCYSRYLSDNSSNFGDCSGNNTLANSCNSSTNDLVHKDENRDLSSQQTNSLHSETEKICNNTQNSHEKTLEERKESFRKLSNIPQEQIEFQNKVLEEIKPRLSRLYSGKFTKHYSTSSVKQDTNNNDETQRKFEDTFDNNVYLNTEDKTLEKVQAIPQIIINNTESSSDENIYDTVKNIDAFYSESEGEYDLLETYNYGNSKFVSLQRTESTSEWVQKTIEDIHLAKYDSFEDEERNENMYDIIKRNYSSGTLCTIYDECNNPAIRVSMMNITDGDLEEEKTQETRIEESEKSLRRSIEEMQDNSRKACLVNELITTERNYIYGSLRRLVHDYMPQMNKKDVPKGLIGKGRQIFGNADLIYDDHKEKFLPELEKSCCIEHIALCFLNHETVFKLYPLYSKNKPKSDLVMRDYGYYFKKKQDELNDKLDLASYLLTPIQRLAKYCLLIKSLVKECEKENIECEKLKAALDMLNKQMRMGNDLIALDSIIHYNGSIRDKGEVLLRDTFMVQPPSKKQPYEGMVFLFQECLLITAIHRQGHQEMFVYKDSFDLTDIGYTNLESEPLEFSVWYRKREINMYRFRTKNQEIKKKWVKEFFNLLWKQLEANKRRRKKELEDNGIKDTRVPVIRPYSVPNKEKESTNSPSKSRRKRTINSSADTIWYALS